MTRPSYDDLAGVYDLAFRGLRLGPLVQQLSLTALDLRAGEIVLDVGCGTGLLLNELAEAVGPTGRVVGVDLSERMLDVARRRIAGPGRGRAPIELVHGDVSAYRAAPDTNATDTERPFDAAVFCLVLSTIPDCAAALRSVCGRVRPGGRVVIADSWLSPEHTTLANVWIALKSGPVHSNPRAGIAALARAELDRVVVRHYFGGVYSVISGIVR